MDEVELLEFAVEVPQVANAIKQYLGLARKEDPLNIPLDGLEWNASTLQLRDDDQYVINEFPFQAAHLKTAVVAIDGEGKKFLARSGDVLIRYNDNTYQVIKTGVK